MSSVQLLDKTRKIGKLLHNNNSSKVVFNDICKVMRDILNSNVLVISRKGKVLGVGKADGIEHIQELLNETVGGFIDPLLNERARRSGRFRPLSPPSRSPARGWVRCLSIRMTSSMTLTILSFVNTGLR